MSLVPLRTQLHVSQILRRPFLPKNFNQLLKLIGIVQSVEMIFVTYRWGSAFNGSPIRKCPGVRTEKSLGSLDKEERSREFKIASICVNTVDLRKLKI